MPNSWPWSVVTRWMRFTSWALGRMTLSLCSLAYAAASACGRSCRLPRIFSMIMLFLRLWKRALEKEVPLSHGQLVGGLAGDFFAVDLNLVGFRVHLDVWSGIVELQVRLGEVSDPGDRPNDLLQAQLLRDAGIDCRLGKESDGGLLHGLAERGKHWPHGAWLRRGDRGVGIAHQRVGDLATLQHQLGFHAEERGVPQHKVREFALLHGSDGVGHALCDGRVDGVLRHVALEAEVV